MECRSTLLWEEHSEANLYRPQVAGILAFMVNEDLVAALVLEVLRRFEIGVRMTAKNNVKTRCAGNEVRVHVGMLAPTEMTEADDHVAMLFVPQPVDDGLRGFGWPRVTHPLIVLCRNQSLRLRTNAQDAYAYARAFYYNIWLDKSLAWCACEVIVAADEGELCHSHQPGKVLKAEVELMVADGAGIVSHQVHQPDFHLTLIKVVIDRALTEVAAVEQEQVAGMFLAHLLEQNHSAQIAALVRLGRVAEIRRDRLDARMRVAGMDYE